MPHGLLGNYSIVGGCGWDSRCLTSWVLFPPSPSTRLRFECQPRCLRQQEAHGTAASSVVAFDSETNESPPSHHFIWNGPTKHGIYKQELL